jgi:hypothetical protein
MNDADRNRLRALQNRWLALPSVQAQIRLYGEHHQIAGAFYATNHPSFHDVRTKVLPQWEAWFMEFFNER